MAVVSELTDERFWGEAVSQTLDTERSERLRLTKENKELQVSLLKHIAIISLLSITSGLLKELIYKNRCLNIQYKVVKNIGLTDDCCCFILLHLVFTKRF